MTRTSMTFSLNVSLTLMLASLTAAPVVAQAPAPAQVVLPTDRTVLPILCVPKTSSSNNFGLGR